MKVTIIAVGTKMPAWVEAGCGEYIKRLPRDYNLRFIEIPVGARAKNPDIQRAKQSEADAILATIPKGDWVVALDVAGKIWSTEQLATHLDSWRMSGNNVCILIGGPDGYAPSVLARANQRWSMSHLTLPHPLVRIVLAEQLYRAHTILHNHPYHK
ncbi:23S rRNA (pseudouridine(1915)-N(3))-methyltransferase RlmH [uncultured Umboniibacter sp.]|uniref:23S rRNA (pseudouridine(1915)-N(3))-methyltransferase RlmH n=1 Tax=uncultured Umboniibacter sp. TaxID=1798917 RepID=UPI0026171A34|nr:23S rRNA (pseudouridine(1915)-N(3))-methyltransferase RlmH [uncultured Umboniibacter sp.]